MDILEQKITMPLLGAFMNASDTEVSEVKVKINRIHEHPEYSGQILEFVREKHGVQYAEKRLAGYVSDAVGALSVLPRTQAVRHLEDMADYVARRNK